MKLNFKKLLICIFFIALIPLSLQTYKIAKRIIMERKAVHHTEYSASVQKFLKVMGKLESGNDPSCISTTGYLGSYQFSINTLKDIGFTMPVDSFLNNKELQDSAMVTYMRENEKILYSYIHDCSGYKIGEAYITKAGILAGAHTHGPGAIISFCRSNGVIDAEDGNGIKVSQRIQQFSNIHINQIK